MELGKYSLNLVIWMEILIKINGNHTDFLIFQIQDFLIINCGCIKIIQQNFIFIELTICKKKKNVQTVIAFHQHIIRLMGKFLYIVTRPFRTAVIRVQTVFVLMTS